MRDLERSRGERSCELVATDPSSPWEALARETVGTVSLNNSASARWRPERRPLGNYHNGTEQLEADEKATRKLLSHGPYYGYGLWTVGCLILVLVSRISLLAMMRETIPIPNSDPLPFNSVDSSGEARNPRQGRAGRVRVSVLLWTCRSHHAALHRNCGLSSSQPLP